MRFLLHGGLPAPLLTYERASSGVVAEREASRRVDTLVAARSADPEGRCDDGGRPISHDVRMPPDPDGVPYAIQVWPLLADAHAQLWVQRGAAISGRSEMCPSAGVVARGSRQ